MMMKSVSIYIKKNEDLIFIPYYEYDNNMVEGEKYYTENLNNADLVKRYLRVSFLEAGGLLKIRAEKTGIELAQGIKGWTKAIKDLMVVNLKYVEDIGIFFELNKRSRGGFVGYKRVMLGPEFNESIAYEKLYEIIKGGECKK